MRDGCCRVAVVIVMLVLVVVIVVGDEDSNCGGVDGFQFNF